MIQVKLLDCVCDLLIKDCVGECSGFLIFPFILLSRVLGSSNVAARRAVRDLAGIKSAPVRSPRISCNQCRGGLSREYGV